MLGCIGVKKVFWGGLHTTELYKGVVEVLVGPCYLGTKKHRNVCTCSTRTSACVHVYTICKKRLQGLTVFCLLQGAHMNYSLNSLEGVV